MEKYRDDIREVLDSFEPSDGNVDRYSDIVDAVMSLINQVESDTNDIKDLILKAQTRLEDLSKALY